MKLGDKLKKIRFDNHLTMDELADRLNKKYDLKVSKSMISRWENNLSEPLNTSIAAYAKEFNVDMNWLIGIEEDSYYLDPEVARMAQELQSDPELRLLFNASRKVAKEDIEKVKAILELMKKEENGG